MGHADFAFDACMLCLQERRHKQQELQQQLNEKQQELDR
jgi:hypothetical protein